LTEFTEKSLHYLAYSYDYIAYYIAYTIVTNCFTYSNLRIQTDLYSLSNFYFFCIIAFGSSNFNTATITVQSDY
jgi:hypothetical protein